MRTLDNVCQGCQKRAVGCRTACQDWAKHEARKAENYRQRAIAIASSPENRRMEQSKRLYVKECKRGRCG